MAVAPIVATAPTWVPWVVSGAATLGGAAISSKSNRSATKEQGRQFDRSMAFAQENEAQRRREYEAEKQRKIEEDRALRVAWQAEQARLAPARATREAVLRGIGQRFGISVPSSSSYLDSDTPPPGWVPGMPTSSGSRSSSRGPTITDLMAAGNSTGYSLGDSRVTPGIDVPRLTLADLFGRNV